VAAVPSGLSLTPLIVIIIIIVQDRIATRYCVSYSSQSDTSSEEKVEVSVFISV
jgi:hypothetical protein